MTPFLVLATLLAAGDPCGLPPLRHGAVPWHAGEVLRYDLEILGMVKAGTMELEAGRPMFEGTQIPLKARVKNSSVFAKIRRIVGAAYSWVDARTLLPERARDDVLEDGVKKTSDARIRGGGGAVTIETDYGGQKGSTTYDRRGEVLDALSAAYYLRAAELKPGQEICFDVVGLRRFWRFRGKVSAKPERVESPGGLFDTLRVEGSIERADKPEVKRPLYVWISTDSRRVLVGAVSEIELGPASALLSRPP